MRPLEGITVLEVGQYLSAPFAGLKLADLGARVIKVERPGAGDPCRNLYISDPVGGENTLFHAINRGKESLTADLRDPDDRALLREIIQGADVMIQNFRPGVIERQGLGYQDVRQINPKLVYGSISGFGPTDWAALPGQDLLAQARSGLMWLTGSRDDPPMPMGLAAADMLAGEALVQGILAGLVGALRGGTGTHVETSLIEALVSFQFEVLTTYLNDGGKLPDRAGVNGAHAYIGAPYGVYPTRDGWLALAMVPSLSGLAGLMGIPALTECGDDPASAIRDRDAIKALIAEATPLRSTAEWLAILQPADIWCAEVLDWPGLIDSAAFRQLDMVQDIGNLRTVRGPLRIGGAALAVGGAAPGLGADRARIVKEFARH
ncbi:CaiB/BaiF CoA transferase family protein [Paracoccus lutimaris]|uniref:Crotonobetainyl-CoA:carnitine CoA-transferase CaiB-like acyl-CoA transferase n=1 Tax=Paracoccus lutimaris TaxID=1490030 RepID=A0A368Z699_9RHOB|nr:CaiB/BaiF CoA-transferase family protein [Paracoccus lutimaris]RCW87026.1 crotonobetainyl-CoA:carnitine CoA-transferase CaiB-like acyl-CoA transferase [Paracoccus lutimaris]